MKLDAMVPTPDAQATQEEECAAGRAAVILINSPTQPQRLPGTCSRPCRGVWRHSRAPHLLFWLSYTLEATTANTQPGKATGALQNAAEF